jgi:hypothetical protein
MMLVGLWQKLPKTQGILTVVCVGGASRLGLAGLCILNLFVLVLPDRLLKLVLDCR